DQIEVSLAGGDRCGESVDARKRVVARENVVHAEQGDHRGVNGEGARGSDWPAEQTQAGVDAGDAGAAAAAAGRGGGLSGAVGKHETARVAADDSIHVQGV